VASTHVLLLRASGPLQAWGIESRFAVRDTAREPSKSGIVGLLAAALGCPRDAPPGELATLAALRMGVRADQEGTILRDYHTAGTGGYYRAGGQIERENVIPGNRYYLQDARFLVGLESEDLALLARLHAALRDPHWPLYLGRKACVPGEPVWLPDGLREHTSLEEALVHYPWLGPPWLPAERRPSRLRLLLEDPAGELVRPDQPVSFHELDRRYAPRRVRVTACPAPAHCLQEEVAPCTSPA